MLDTAVCCTSKLLRFTYPVPVLTRICNLYVVALVVAGLSKNMTELLLAMLDEVIVVAGLVPADGCAMAVESLTRLTNEVFAPLLKNTVAKTKILLVVLDGVTETDKPVISTNDVLVTVCGSFFKVLTTCKTRKAPRKLFNSAASKTLPATNVAGSVVGVAISAPYPKTFSASSVPYTASSNISSYTIVVGAVEYSTLWPVLKSR